MSDATVQIFASVLGIRARCRSMPPDDMITLPPLISWTYSSSIFFAPVFVTIHSPAPAFPSLHFSQLFPFLHFSQNARRRYVGSTIPNCRTSKLSGAPARSSPKGRPRLAPSSEGMTRSSSATAKTSSPSSNPCRRALNCETTLPSSSFEQVVPLDTASAKPDMPATMSGVVALILSWRSPRAPSIASMCRLRTTSFSTFTQ
mmetsp:Transcript_17781/g.57524  ORF Transcript_17781/g.57524 Transcript_17781/m.57524 type:complete len:202 (-) Transcript_17781:716-1321(-)